jgi:hypothetical protein
MSEVPIVAGLRGQFARPCQELETVVRRRVDD